MLALRKRYKKSEKLMSFICNILGIDVENVVSNSIRDNAKLEYQALNDELAEVKKEMYSCLTDITECKISLNKYISELENNKNNNSNNNNSNNILNKVKDINKLVIKHIKAFNLLKNSEKIKLIDKYIYKDSYEADDEIARESIKIGLFSDLHYIYNHKRVYEFNINGLDYKI